MKKILITGMNKAQTTKDFFLSQQLKVVPSHYSVIRCLEDLGYYVEHREVALGEDLSQWDDVIFYMHSPQGFCQRLYQGLYALSQRPDAVIAFDDWQIDSIYAGIEGFRDDCKEGGEKAFREYLLSLQADKLTLQDVTPYLNNYIEACEVILAKKNRLLVSAFAGGDLGLLKLGWQEDRVFRFNPNPFHLNRTPENNFGAGVVSFFTTEVNPADKKREWNFASLVQNRTKKWLKNERVEKWPVSFYGQKNGEEKNTRLTEDEMCRVFSEQWGCLMPGYFHSGSGWWRARPLQVADAGSILVCDDKEGAVFGDAYVGVRAGDVEDMDLSQLVALAKRQKESLYDKHPLDKNVTRQEITAILEALHG